MCEPFDLGDVLEHFSVPAAILSQSRRIVAANRLFRCRFAAGGDPFGRSCYELLHDSQVPCETQGLDCPLVRCLAVGSPGRAFHRHRSKLGHDAVELTVCEVARDQDDVAYFLHLTRSVPDRWLPDELLPQAT